MQWLADAKAGFTTGISWEPVNTGFEDVNVSLQDEDADSLLNQYRKLIQLRNSHEALRTGAYLPFTSSCRLAYPVLRVDEDEAIIILANLGRMTLEGCTLSIETSPLEGEYQVEVLLGDGGFDPILFDSNGAVNAYQISKNLEGWEELILLLKK